MERNGFKKACFQILFRLKLLKAVGTGKEHDILPLDENTTRSTEEKSETDMSDLND